MNLKASFKMEIAFSHVKKCSDLQLKISSSVVHYFPSQKCSSIFIPVKHKIKYGDLEVMFSHGEERQVEICRGRILIHVFKENRNTLL